ncbi:CopG family transcriptional regulator [Nocardia puris]|uniref:ribbon-helix-helix protein, CopG family n=1 Tax=Nocardia puris TaxID=208602 RepID=UPI001893099D|nr:ribbon-helix-helix protein, CopG family [Nocardia puris]MBF6211023.1 CopG family transcriptional regulator [Nocardia puris]MBF6364619.1 CopG family transcriptional regulator [Nocardia puris]MBF6459548.1 CopG family transcriptional regulator [Nocardia puris]
MSLKRTMVYAEAEDLAAIKDAAARTNVSEAEIIRDAIHLAAMRVRRRNEPLRLRRFASGDPTLAHRVDEILSEDDEN